MRALAATCLALAALAAGCGDDEPDRVDGEGYSYAVPDGWDDVSDQAEDEPGLEIAGIGPDTVVIADEDDGFATNVNVIRESGLPPGVTAAQYAEISIAALSDPGASALPPEAAEAIRKLQPSQISQPSKTELGGEDAIAWDYMSSQNGRDLRHKQLAAVVDDTAYTVTLSSLPDHLDEGQEALDDVVDSWEWE